MFRNQSLEIYAVTSQNPAMVIERPRRTGQSGVLTLVFGGGGGGGTGGLNGSAYCPSGITIHATMYASKPKPDTKTLATARTRIKVKSQP